MATTSLGQLTLDLTLETGNFTSGLSKAERQTRRNAAKMDREFKRLTGTIKAMGAAAVTAAAVGFVALTKEGLASVDAQAKLARQLDSSIGGLRSLQLAANEAGIATGTLNGAMGRLSARLGDALLGTGKAADALKRIGLSARNLAAVDVDRRIATIADRVQELGLSGAETANLLRELGIRNTEMVNLLRQGGNAIRDARDNVEAFGLAVSDVDAAAVEAANDAMERLGLASESLQTTLAVKLAPALNDMADAMLSVAKSFAAGEFDAQLRILQSVSTTVGIAAAGWLTYRTGVRAATAAQILLNGAMRANPIGLIITAAAGAVTALGALGAALDDSAEKARRMEGRANELAASLRAMGETSIRTRLAAVTVELAKMDGASEALAESNRRRSRDNRTLGGTIADLRENIELTTRANATSSGEAEKLRTQQMALQKALDTLQGSARPAAESIREISAATGDADKKMREAQREADEFARSLRALIDQLFPVEAHQREFVEQQAILNRALDEGTLSADRHAEALARLDAAQLSTQRPEDVFDFLDPDIDRVEEQFNAMDDFAKNAARSMKSYFADFLFNPFDDGLKGMLQGFTTAVQRMVAEAVAADLTRRLFGSAVQGGSGGGLFGSVAGLFSSFDGGGFTGDGPRAGGLDGKGGFAAILHPNETVIDHTEARTSRGGRPQSITNNFVLEQREDRRTQRQIAMRASEAQRKANARFGA